VAAVRYRLSMPEPHTHLLHVELEVDGVGSAASLAMPSWTPGSYLMREFPRNVQGFAATDGAGAPLSWTKADKNRWRVDAPADGALRVSYQVYANELTVRTSHLDATHALVNGASVFLYPEDRAGEPLSVQVDAPDGWRITTALRPGEGGFVAPGYDELVDAPMEIGTHRLLEWEVAGKTHRWAIWGRGNYDEQRLAADTSRIILAEEALFGTLPYPDYTFIVHLTPGGGGGLEHRDSTVLLADRWAFRGQAYERFLGLVAHEFFHLWNGKRIRPAVLGPFDYTAENYTRDLWVVEGITSYYTDLLLRRAGLITSQRYLERLAEAIARFQAIPGRAVQTLADSSWDTWIKFYRPDPNTPNSSISYYEKGALVAFLLDLLIRSATDNERSLDDVMRRLWAEYGAPDVGFPEGEVERIAAEVAGTSLADFFDLALRGTAELPFESILETAGLVLRPSHELAPAPFPAIEASTRTEVRTGLQFRPEGGRTLVSHVLADTPGYRAGVNAGDELVALDGVRITPDTLHPRLAERRHGDRLPLTVFRRDELLTLELEVELVPPARLTLRLAASPTPGQQRLLDDWLRVDVPEAPSVEVRRPA
jgi:predicted metalloprotease with PDZ domain